jgi:hypothetical protein
MVDLFTIKERLATLLVYDKGRSGQRYDRIRVNFALHFNKTALTVANLCKLEEKHS